MAGSKKKKSIKPETSAASAEEVLAAEENRDENQDAAAGESVENAAKAESCGESLTEASADQPTVGQSAEDMEQLVEDIIAEQSAEDTEQLVEDIIAEQSADKTVRAVSAEDTAAAEAVAETADEKSNDAAAAKINTKKPGGRLPDSVRQAAGDVLDTCESIIIAMFTVLLIFTYLFSVAIVEGDSMLPTLREGDRLLLVNFGSPDAGDIVVLESRFSYIYDSSGDLVEDNGLGKKIVKRLIATENQTVNIDFAAGIVYVDGVPLEENYTSTLTTRDEGAFQYPITVPEGYVFVLGDNRSVSKDSRHPDVGLIPEKDIVGTVWLRVYPFTDFAAVQ